MGRATLVTLVGALAVVGTAAMLLVVPNSEGSAVLQVTLPSESIAPMALAEEQVPPTRT